MSASGDTVEDAPVTLSALEFDVLWEHVAPGTMPLVLRVPSPGRTLKERDALVRSVTRQPDAELERLFDVLARPEKELDARIWVGGATRALACSAYGRGVLATLTGRTLALRPISPDSLVSAILSVLPPVHGGAGRSVSVRTADLEAAAHGNLAAGLRDRGVRDDDATTLATMISTLRGSGNFGVATRDRMGRRRRAERVVSFFDTDHGRYVQVPRDGWTTISPADHRRLAQHLSELLDEP